jgi:hypothetical protein
VELDEAVHGFGAAVVGAAGVEVAEERSAPLSQGASEAGDLGDRACGEAVEDFERDPSPGGVAGLVIDRTELLGAAPGDLDLDVTRVGVEGVLESSLLPLGEASGAGAQDVADPVQRVVLAAAVAVDVLLDPAPDLVDRGRAELDDMERVMPTSA